MPCSPEQHAANQRNAQKSSGPVTLEGKLRSSKNSYKHGLTGAGTVISDEDVAEVQVRIGIFERDLKPANDVARLLAHRAAFLSLLLERSAREEASRINRAMLLARDVEEDARHDEIERLALLITQDPAEAVRKLRRTPEGIDRLIGGWEAQKATLLNPSSAIGTGDVLFYLMGRHPVNASICRVTVLIRALGFNFSWLSDWPDLPEHERKEMALGELIEIIDREVAGLKVARAESELNESHCPEKTWGELGSSWPGGPGAMPEVKTVEEWVGRRGGLAKNGRKRGRNGAKMVGSTT